MRGSYRRLLLAFLAALATTVFCSATNAAELKLNPSQKQQLKALGEDIKRQTNDLRDRLRTERQALWRLYSSYDLDEKRVRAQIRKVNGIQADLLEVGLDDQIRLRKIVPEDQFSVLAEMQKDKMHKPGMWGGDRHHDRDRHEREQFKGVASAFEQTDVSPAQREALQKLYKGTRESRMQRMQELRDAAKDLQALYGSYQLNVKEARAAIRRLNRAQLNLMLSHLDQQKKVRRILTADQFQAVQSKLRNMGDHRPHR